MSIVTLKLTHIAKTSVCAAAEDGERVFDAIVTEFDKGNKVVVSFKDVKFVISAFLNPAIGKLYGRYDESFIREMLSVTDVTIDHVQIIKEVTDNAKKYFMLRPVFESVFSYDEEHYNESEKD